MFGGKSAPYIFNLFAEALHWIIEMHIPANLCHYLDDFLPIFKLSVLGHQANKVVNWVEELMGELSLSFQMKKTVRPTTSLEFLGLELNSSAMEAHLPIDKLDYLQETLVNCGRPQCCSLRNLQELIGYLQFCMQVIPHGCTFIHGLINFSMTFPSDFSQRHIPAYARSDIHWWLTYMRSWNSIQILELTKATLHVCMDASGSKALGGVYGKEWF